jgi:hypothetical protein
MTTNLIAAVVSILVIGGLFVVGRILARVLPIQQLGVDVLESHALSLLHEARLTVDERERLQVAMNSLQAVRNGRWILIIPVNLSVLLRDAANDIAEVWTRVHGAPPHFTGPAQTGQQFPDAVE